VSTHRLRLIGKISINTTKLGTVHAMLGTAERMLVLRSTIPVPISTMLGSNILMRQICEY